MSTGRAAVVTEYGSALEITEFPLPVPEPGAVLVRVEVATVCGSDVHGWEGAYQGVLPVELPLILGHEAVGVVAAIGDGATLDSLGRPLDVGDRVVWAPESCGRCYECTVARRSTLCGNRTLGMLTSAARPPHFNGMFAEYSYIRPRAGRLRVPDELPSELASVATCAVRTVVNAMELAGALDYRHTVLVQGAGPVGLFCVAMAVARGVRRVIVIDAAQDRLALARSWGAQETLAIDDLDGDERLTRVLEITNGRGADVLFEASGAPSAIEEGLSMAAKAGRYVLIGSTGKGSQQISPHYIVNRGLTILGSFSGDIDSFAKAMQFLVDERDRIDWEAVLGRRYDLAGVEAAMRSMQARADTKPVIRPWGDP